jgi:hypothetical protein
MTDKDNDGWHTLDILLLNLFTEMNSQLKVMSTALEFVA